MIWNIATTILSVFICVLVTVPLSAQGYVDVLPSDIKNPFQEKFTLITSRLDDFRSDEWVGKYTRDVGETWSDVLVWTPNEGFAAFRDTCSNGPRAWVNFGGAKFESGRLILNSEQINAGEHSLPVKREFTPVKWGHQRWLIPTDELELFAYAVNSGSWEDYGRFYLKSGETDDDPKGQPEIPTQFKHILKRKPVNAKLMDFRKYPDKWYGEGTIDAGKNKGVIVGMSFWLLGVKNVNVKISVIEVNEKSAVARVTSIGYEFDGNESSSAPDEFVPKPGLRFTSRSPYND